MTGINIYSGTKGLGGALTNPTCLAKRKGSIQQDYVVVFRERTFPDAEAAYAMFCRPLPFEEREAMMAQIIEAKLRQHPRLLAAIDSRGGGAWLETCWHKTGARTVPFKRWEGDGRGSAFIRALIAGYETARLAQSLANALFKSL